MSRAPQSAPPSATQRRRTAIAGVVATVLIGVVVVVSWLVSGGAESTSSSAGSSAGTSTGSSTGTSQAAKTSAGAQIPARVRTTLALIDAGRWPAAANAPGTRGGITFRNSERRLPATDARGERITYREWDVNPKEPGRSRDAQRIVTGSDGSAWYTADHYRSFVKIRGPDS